MRRVLAFITIAAVTQVAIVQAAAPFSTFRIKFDYSLNQPALTSINSDIAEIDQYFHSGVWAEDLQGNQGGDDNFDYPLMLDTGIFQNLPAFAVRVETNLDLLWHLGVEYRKGGVSSHGLYAYAPGGQNDGYVKRRETFNYTSTLLYGKFQIRDRNLPLFAYVGAGAGFSTLQVEGLYRMGNKFNADYMQEWLIYENDHSGTAFTGRGFLGLEYQVNSFSLLYLELGYDYQNFGELDGSTSLALNDPYLPANYDLDPDNDFTEYYSLDGSRPATYDYVYDFLYWYVDENENGRYDFGEAETDTFTGAFPYEGTYNSDYLDFDLSGFYFNVGLGISF
ncbi:MAG: hypothetical protein ISR91_00035 [Candidatus Delongbacteria bacterium]|nr:hypothetical protein [Candidatus Delongbacteria bacterium]